MAIYFFWGDEDYLIDKELKKYRSKLDKNFAQMNYVVYDKLSFSDLISVIRTQPMMFGKLMIVINTHNLLPDTGAKRQSLLAASFDDNQLKELETSLELAQENNGEALDIFFVERYSDSDKSTKPDTRRKIYKILSKYTTQNFKSIESYRTPELIEWLSKLAKDKKLKINPDAIQALVESKKNNFQALNTELNKLAVYAYPETVITKSMVDDVCESNEHIFNLTDYLMEQNKTKALIELRKLLENKHPLEVLSVLQTMLKQWICIKLHSKTKSNAEIGKKIGKTDKFVYVALQKMKNVSLKSLVDLKNNITEAEYNIKTGQAFNPQEELENAIIR